MACELQCSEGTAKALTRTVKGSTQARNVARYLGHIAVELVVASRQASNNRIGKGFRIHVEMRNGNDLIFVAVIKKQRNIAGSGRPRRPAAPLHPSAKTRDHAKKGRL